MLSNISSKALTSFKYIYLVAFFALLSGFFYPFITNSSFGNLITGILILFVGLFGSILLYKASTSNSKKEIFLAVGFILIGISLYFIFQMTGRV